MALPPVILEEPDMRNQKRRDRRNKPFHLYFKGRTMTFHTKAELAAYLSSMRAKRQ